MTNVPEEMVRISIRCQAFLAQSSWPPLSVDRAGHRDRTIGHLTVGRRRRSPDPVSREHQLFPRLSFQVVGSFQLPPDLATVKTLPLMVASAWVLALSTDHRFFSGVLVVFGTTRIYIGLCRYGARALVIDRDCFDEYGRQSVGRVVQGHAETFVHNISVNRNHQQSGRCLPSCVRLPGVACATNPMRSEVIDERTRGRCRCPICAWERVIVTVGGVSMTD